MLFMHSIYHNSIFFVKLYASAPKKVGDFLTAAAREELNEESCQIYPSLGTDYSLFCPKNGRQLFKCQ